MTLSAVEAGFANIIAVRKDVINTSAGAGSNQLGLGKSTRYAGHCHLVW